MPKTLLVIRIVFIALCAVGAWLVVYTEPEWDRYRKLAIAVGFLIGALVVLVDLMLKGFSLRALGAITFGLAIGSLIAWLIGTSPLFNRGDEQIIYLTRLALFIICAYLGTVIALRGKDEFNLVIPYVRFVPHEVDVPLMVLDPSALIDGRIARFRGQAAPVEQLAGVLFTGRGDIGMTQHIARADLMALHDIPAKPCHRHHLRLRERAITEFMAGIHDLDTDRGAVDIT